MNWKELIKSEVEHNYPVTEKLMDLVDDDKLDWKPSTGNNWMTTGQLLMHTTSACGACFRGFVTGDWAFPDGMDLKDLPPDQMLPPAENMPGIGSVKEAKDLLAADKKLALDMLAQCDEAQLVSEKKTAPWDPTEKILGHRLLEMINHLNSHKAQLFYYLKLQGKPVNTLNLWGM